jgi:hypothetical protein
VIVRGVGQSLVASVSAVPLWRPLSGVLFSDTPLCFSSVEVAVGQNEHTLALMWRAKISRADEERINDIETQSA